MSRYEDSDFFPEDATELQLWLDNLDHPEELTPPPEELPIGEVRKRLNELGIDVGPTLERVKAALLARRSRP